MCRSGTGAVTLGRPLSVTEHPHTVAGSRTNVMTGTLTGLSRGARERRETGIDYGNPRTRLVPTWRDHRSLGSNRNYYAMSVEASSSFAVVRPWCVTSSRKSS
jgi:hypothetical protein